MGAAPLPQGDRVAGALAPLPEPFRSELEDVERGDLVTPDGVRLAYAAHRRPRARAAVVLLTGRTETYAKYGELFAELARWDLALYTYDHRGQGLSQRLLGDPEDPDDPGFQKGWVARFDDYVADFEAFLAQVVAPDHPRALLGLSHSMGGAVLTAFAQRRPAELAGLVLAAPMHRIFVNAWQARLVDLMVRLGRGEDYARGEGPWDGGWEPFEENRTTSSPERYQRKQDLFAGRRHLWLGGCTWGWVREALRATDAMRRDAGALRDPALLLQAGREELVDNAGQDEVAAGAARCRKQVVAEGKHELLLERDDLREEALAATREAFEAALAR